MENLRNNYSVEDDEEEGDEMEIERRQNQDDNGGTGNPEFDEETEDMWANGDSLPSKAAKPPKPRKRIQNFDFKDSNYSEDFDEYEEMEDNEDDEDDEDINFQTKIQPLQNAYEENPISTPASDEEQSLPKKQNSHACFTSQSPTPETSNPPTPATTTATSSKKKKKNNNVWTKSTSRKGKKKSKTSNNVATDHTVLVPSIPRFQDKTDDSPEMKICLSKVYKAEKVELSDDRLSAGSTKGYRMVRATRGVKEGAWYFEIRVEKLGETGHTRLGWSTEKGDLQAPVGYDSNSFGYRDLDGSKVHKALREKYGEEGYNEGDVIGCYINLPEGEKYAPKPPHLVWYKGQRYAYAADGKEDPPKVVPGSEISFFKNGICQGVAFKDLFGGRYYPAASMYTLPHQPNCVVKFNFGPDFEVFPQDFASRPTPRPMIDVPYHGLDAKVEVLAENGLSTQKKG